MAAKKAPPEHVQGTAPPLLLWTLVARSDEVRRFDPTRVKTDRYLYRGMKIPAPWPGNG
ncbi:hypothetical protein SAMN05216489_00493 [Streptomyces sp. 3213]|uniref:hypothetical protein n=1 Tax=Streptomyces sp. 3213.3 TaxID=1855348 RepID=UPI00089A1C5E|nr:hypothetical protein [Streptomyces sp. 3213.3]SEC34367.1 hypothetical protein SAMN05216489_00493 [Streptomyces sp. 3213] [Streptomyces sp. 3213.3]